MSNPALRTWVTPGCKIRFLPRDTFKFLFKFQKKQLKEEHTHTQKGRPLKESYSIPGGGHFPQMPKCRDPINPPWAVTPVSHSPK